MGLDDDDDGTVARVTLLSTRERPRGRSILAEIEAYWRELAAASGRLPRRSEVDAGRIAAALPHAFVLERVAGIGRLRIAGQSVAGLLGAEAKGVPLGVLFTAAARPELQSILDRCFETPALAEVGVVAPPGPIRGPLKGRLILLPLLDAEGKVTRALGGLLVDGPPRRGPVRFDLEAVPRRLEPIQAQATPGHHEAAPSMPIRGFGEAQRPYLRLVVSNA